MSGILDGVVAEGVWTGIAAYVRHFRGQGIQIISPRPQEVLPDRRPLGDLWSYRVDGTLKSLRKGHAIWLLHQNDITGRVWPQGFEAVQYNPLTQEWFGRISVSNETGSYVRLVAVVAPPTSQDFFNYFQRNGAKTNWEGLNRIPPESWNQCHVQAQVP